MASIDDLLITAFKTLPPKPSDDVSQAEKKRYSEQVSEKAAQAIGEELRLRGLRGSRPAPPGELDVSGAERRMAGGIGAKKVDVTWATEESGLLLGISIKSINFKDRTRGNFQKNLTNRRGDMLMEAVTLHRRFPYAVLGGLFFLDAGAAEDGTTRRRSTFLNAHARLQLFTGREDPAGRDEQFEKMYPTACCIRTFEVGNSEDEVPLKGVIDKLVHRVAVRNPDFYEYLDSNLRHVPR